MSAVVNVTASEWRSIRPDVALLLEVIPGAPEFVISLMIIAVCAVMTLLWAC